MVETLFKQRFLLGLSPEGFHRMAYREYGESTNPCLVCVHGLTRNSADFHYLAKGLMDRYRVVAPDVVGRGQSDRLKNKKLYSYLQYMADMNAFIQRLDVKEGVDWLGTSMGGLFGILLASQPQSPIRRLILNDIGPFVPGTAIERIKSYAGIELTFPDIATAEAALKATYEPFGPMNEEQWSYLFMHSIRQKEDGQYTLDYDPAAAAAVEGTREDHQTIEETPQGDVTFWRLWARIQCPVLVINGRHSDILPKSVLDKMHGQGPDFDHVYVEDTGHAPSLMPKDQVQKVSDWLDKTKP